MKKNYKEIDFGCGCSIQEAVKQLIEYITRGEFVCGEFNGHMLYSDTVSIDSAYLEITGKTYSDFIATRQRK